MFSPSELLHFVFADGNDLYFCNEVLELDLNQYLWLKLHDQGYGCVYYLDLSRDEASIRTYGDRLAQRYKPEKPHWVLSKQKLINSSLHKWILKQLTEKDPKRSAIICELHEFCSYFDDPVQNDFLRDLASLSKRTGILVLTAQPEAEASRSLFLSSPVFEHLREASITGLRTASPCAMYTYIHRSKPGRMLYLNAYTAERIHSMLTRILLEDSTRTMDCDLLPDMEAYLLQWLNNPELRKKDAQLEKMLPAPEDSFRSSYARLRKKECWTQLTEKAMQLSRVGGIQNYVGELGCGLAEDPSAAVRVRRDPGSYAGRCLNLRLHTAVMESEEREKIQKLLESIRKQVTAPLNREDNPKITDMVNSLLPELSSADLSEDAATVSRILYSINFCIHWVSVSPNSSEEDSILGVLDKLKRCIELSRTHYDQKQSLSIIRTNPIAGKAKVTPLAVKQLENKAETTRRQLSLYDDMIQASIVEISMGSAASLSELAQKLAEDWGKLSEDLPSKQDWKRGINAVSDDKQQAAAERKSVEEEEFFLTDDDYKIPF